MGTAVSFHGAVAAVVTTFNAGDAIRPNLARIAGQVKVVIVVDDSGNPTQAHALDCAAIGNAIVLRNEDNLGIAAALNRGIAHAQAMGCDWVITLDDDTLVSTTYMDDISAFVQTGAMASAGLIACTRDGGDPGGLPGGNGFTVKRTLITSGCVFQIKTFREVGGFDESLFIDLVDFDFCTKLRKSGRDIVLLNKVGMDHRVGNSRMVRLLGKKIVIYNHSPFRLYYQMRNVFSFARKHLTFDPLLSVYLLLDVFRLPLKALLFEQEKRARFFYLATGLQDGLLGRGGRLTRRFRAST
jgi:rhamnosyltransferase